jgi:gluconolactonase
MRSFVTAMIVAAVLATAYTARMRAAENPIVPEGAKLEKLYTRTAEINGGLTEGPAVAPDGSIYFTDIADGTDAGMIVRFDPKTKKNTVFAKDSKKANGLAFDFDGHLIACEGSDYGGQAVSRWNVKTGKRAVIADRYQGKKFNAPNDVVLDTKGRIYFTDPRYLGTEPRELEHRAVYRIDTDGTVVEVTHDIEKPNGIALSPDEKTLYVADHNNGTDQIDPAKPAPKLGAMTITAYPLGKDGLVNGPKKIVVDYGDQAGCDGMCVDVEGNLYLTNRGLKRPGVAIVSPSGKELAFIPTGPENQVAGKPPVGLPSNVEFGIGDEAATLYVTVDKSLYRIPLKVKGYHVGRKG